MEEAPQVRDASELTGARLPKRRRQTWEWRWVGYRDGAEVASSGSSILSFMR